MQFTNGLGSKARPLLVLFQDREDYLMATISTQLQQWGSFDMILKPDTSNRLRATSLIRVSKLSTLSGEIIVKKLGEIDSAQRSQLKDNMQKFVSKW